jgi:hypothetical protein
VLLEAGPDWWTSRHALPDDYDRWAVSGCPGRPYASARRDGIDRTGTSVEASTDGAAVEAWLMKTVGDTVPICGTAPMGAPDDPRTVVDPRDRVFGVDGRCAPIA